MSTESARIAGPFHFAAADGFSGVRMPQRHSRFRPGADGGYTSRHGSGTFRGRRQASTNLMLLLGA